VNVKRNRVSVQAEQSLHPDAMQTGRRHAMSWQLDNGHTHVGFICRHMMVSTVRGEFEKIHVKEVLS
jgi:polyisoprenoid-binding protein YceI